jgi:DnaK suppressor protein
MLISQRRKMSDLKKIRTRLENNRKRLLKRTEGTHKESPNLPPNNSTHSYLTWRYDSQQRKRLLLARAESQLAQVEVALQRLDSGDYGKCVNCGQRIHPDRLKALPSATLCINCKHQED